MAGVVLDGPHSFSDSGLLFTYCGSDGKLKTWDTSSGILKQEYTKNLHLSSPCTCLTWLRISKLPVQSTPKKKKLKSSAQDVGDNVDIIAIGTSSGSILLYNVATNNVVSELEGHTAEVSHLTYKNGSLFSCSHDKFIIEWDLVHNKIKSKWKSGKEKISCILALSNGKTLLTASCSIKLWDLEKKQVIRKFTGHATEVTALIEVPERDDYFISAAKGDRVISAWSLSSKDKATPVASFLLQDGASSVHMASSGDESPTLLCAVTESGVLHVFRHKLNGTLSKPLKPITNVSVASESDNDNVKQSSHPIPIHAVLPLNKGNIIIAYGNPVFLSFETISLAENQQENLVLIRQDKRKPTVDVYNSKIKVPEINKDAEYQIATTAPLKRPKGKQLEVPLEDRLDNLALANTTSNEAPKKDNMAQLLIQGLQSKDKNILQNVLFHSEESVINGTVKNLPIQALVPLIKELTTLLHNKTNQSKIAVRWLISVLRNHSGIILSNPEIVNIFEPLLASIEKREAILPSLIRLRGRLNLVTEQIGSNMNEEAEDVNEPLISYQEQDSSEDEDVDLMSDGSESDDNWDEFSDMEDQEEEMDDK